MRLASLKVWFSSPLQSQHCSQELVSLSIDNVDQLQSITFNNHVSELFIHDDLHSFGKSSKNSFKSVREVNIPHRLVLSGPQDSISLAISPWESVKMNQAAMFTCSKTKFDIWCDDAELKTGSVIYFSRDKVDAHTAVVCDLEKHAEDLHQALMENGHAVLSAFTPVLELQVDGNTKHVVGFAREGVSLDNFVRSTPRTGFYDGDWPNDFLHKLLFDLITAVHAYRHTCVDVVLSSESIFVLDGRVTVAQWECRKSQDLVTNFTEYGKIAEIISFIDHHFGTNKHLVKLRNILANPTDRELDKMCHLPIFWSDVERIEFIKDMSEFFVASSHAICDIHSGKSPFKGKKLQHVSAHPELGDWRTYMMTRPSKIWVNKVNSAIKQRQSALFQANEPEAMECLGFSRKCLSHFAESKQGALPLVLPIGSKKEMVDKLDEVFTELLWELCELALKEADATILLPVRGFLRELFFEDRTCQ